MKKISLLLTCFCCMFVAHLAAAQLISPTGTKYIITAPKEGPQVSFEQVEYDFGTVVQGKEVSFNFKFINDGTEPLIVENVRASCDCTSSYYPEAPVLPGKESMISLSYDSEKSGIFYRTVKVFFKGIKRPVILSISGEVEPNGKEENPIDKIKIISNGE